MGSIVAGMQALLVGALIAASVPAPVVRGGGPSAPADPKVAIAASAKPLAGKKFKVLNARGKVVLRGKLKKVKGNPDPWRHAASADWSKVAKPGSYRIKAGGATSRPWQVAGGRPIDELLRIYAVNTDGNEPNPVFGPVAPQRRHAQGRRQDRPRRRLARRRRHAEVHADDRGVRLLPAHRRAPGPRARGPAEGRPRRSASAGSRRRIRQRTSSSPSSATSATTPPASATPRATTPTPRSGVGKRIAYPSISSNVLGEAAAALALAGQVDAAKQWYEQAVQTNAEVDIHDPNVSDFYPEDFFHDDLAFAADALWRATGEQKYLDDAGKQLSSGSENELYGGIVVGAPRALVAADLCGGLGLPGRRHRADPRARLRRRAQDDGRDPRARRRARLRLPRHLHVRLGAGQQRRGRPRRRRRARRRRRRRPRHRRRRARLPPRPQPVGPLLRRRPQALRGPQPPPLRLPEGQSLGADRRRGRRRRRARARDVTDAGLPAAKGAASTARASSTRTSARTT